MKRMSFILFSTLTIGALTACGQGEDPNTGNNNAGSSNEVNESTENNEEAESGNMAEASNSAEENSNTENNSNAQNNETDNDNAEHEESEDASNNSNAENDSHNNDSSSEESTEENDANNTTNDSDAEEMSEEENNASDNSSANGNSDNHENETEENAGNNAEADEEAALVSPLYLYFSDDQLLTTYKVEADHSVSKDEAGAMEAMELWAAGPSEETLYGLLPEGASVQSVELKDGMAYVSLSADVKDANLGSTGEGMLTDHIAMMMEQFGASQTMILIDGEETSDFLGHLDLSQPIEAGSPDNYEEY
jgi:hypothetical protein